MLSACQEFSDSHTNICPDLCLIYTDTHELHTDGLICKCLTRSPNMNPKLLLQFFLSVSAIETNQLINALCYMFINSAAGKKKINGLFQRQPIGAARLCWFSGFINRLPGGKFPDAWSRCLKRLFKKPKHHFWAKNHSQAGLRAHVHSTGEL